MNFKNYSDEELTQLGKDITNELVRRNSLQNRKNADYKSMLAKANGFQHIPTWNELYEMTEQK